ncbi:MAG: hypothetical protein AAGJ54_03605 [Planctomycetota bacterium]
MLVFLVASGGCEPRKRSFDSRPPAKLFAITGAAGEIARIDTINGSGYVRSDIVFDPDSNSFAPLTVIPIPPDKMLIWGSSTSPPFTREFRILDSNGSTQDIIELPGKASSFVKPFIKGVFADDQGVTVIISKDEVAILAQLDAQSHEMLEVATWSDLSGNVYMCGTGFVVVDTNAATCDQVDIDGNVIATIDIGDGKHARIGDSVRGHQVGKRTILTKGRSVYEVTLTNQGLSSREIGRLSAKAAEGRGLAFVQGNNGDLFLTYYYDQPSVTYIEELSSASSAVISVGTIWGSVEYMNNN